MTEIITNTDWTILYWIQDNLTSPFLDTIMPLITKLGNGGIIWIITAIAMLCSKKYRKYGIILGAGLLAGLIVGNVFLKNIVERPRPCWIDSSVQLLIAVPTDYSFPSGHTLSSVIAATILTLTNKKFGVIAIPLAVLIAFSRLYLFVHFPSDIIGAAFLGLFIAFTVFYISKKVISPKENAMG